MAAFGTSLALLLSSLLLVVAVAGEEPKRYDDYKLVKMSPGHHLDRKEMVKFLESSKINNISSRKKLHCPKLCEGVV